MSGKAKAKVQTHHGDAAVAVDRFIELLPDPTTADEIDAETPLSLIAAAALWSGCIENDLPVQEPGQERLGRADAPRRFRSSDGRFARRL